MATGATPKKRKTGNAASFKKEWEELYFFVPHNENAKCVICNFVVVCLRKQQLERHYNRHHRQEYALYEGEARQLKLNELKAALAIEDTLELDTSKSALRASFKISLRIAKSAKPFSEGDFVKACLIDAAELLCPNEVQHFQQISVSRQTVARRIADLAEDVQRQLMKKCSTFIAYSLALDESTDISDVAQLAVFVRGVDSNLVVTQELLDIIPLKDTTTGEDIFQAVEECCDAVDLQWERLHSVTTDGAPSMRGRKVGFTTRLQAKLEKLKVKLYKVHCFIHQEALCAKVAKLGDIMKVVVRIVNYLRQHGLNHRQFKEFLASLDAEYCDIPYYTEVRWLSRGKVLNRFFLLRQEISLFLDMQGKPEPTLGDMQWVADLAFLADITEHLNELNISMQGRDHLITDLADKIEAFKMKLQLWKVQLENGDTGYFPSLNSVREGANFDEYVPVIEALRKEFSDRFEELVELKPMFDLFVKPFSITVLEVPHEFQMELINLQCSTRLKDVFRNADSLQDFYQRLPQQHYPKLHKQAAKVLSMFGDTYVVETFFSALKVTKTKHRSQMSDENLRNTLRLIATQTIVPDIEHIISSKTK